MNTQAIYEARRLLHDLIFTGKAKLAKGRIIEPKDEWLVTLLEKVASKKVEEPEVPVEVLDFEPRSTYHAKPKEGECND